MTDTNAIDLELTEAECHDELLDNELDRVTGGNLNAGEHFKAAILYCR
jgi:hypothetical protein